ncbi:hypothetical protein ATN89_21780 [Comamonas thiooxydans]|uniref:hypothetical protein n=1 Tax=Comamonas thiooxydans TaxID=363952 RepID=UPI0007C49FC0|nr:hypothetical protein [Comamonas thiooxydans]OAD82124.1 hypothetical protein ATN89_21780 [Comamonas thiooxydans]
MGLYSHLTTEQLTARRDSYLAAIDARLTGPTQASHSTDGVGARSVQFNADTTQLRRWAQRRSRAGLRCLPTRAHHTPTWR